MVQCSQAPVRESASAHDLLRFCMVQCSQARARKREARSARGRASGGLEVIIPRAQSRVHGKSCARGFYFVWIFLKKGVDIGRISSYNNKALRRYAVNAMRNCVMVAPATLTRIVRVRILLPQPNGSICCRFLSGYSAVGSALRSGRRGLEFKSQSISLTKDRRGAAPRRSFIFSEFLWFHWANEPQSMNHLLLCAVSSTGCFTASPFLPSKSRPQPVATATTITANSVKP